MFSFLKSVFSEDGQGSYSRSVGGLIALATVTWITYVVFKTKAIPDLSGPTVFFTAGSGSHYLVNKAGDIVDSFKGNNKPQQ